MKKLFLILGFMFLASMGYSALMPNATYYNLQNYKVVKSTGDANEPINKFYYRGDFYIVNDTFTVQIADITPYLILYSTGTIWAKRVEAENAIEVNNLIVVSSQTAFTRITLSQDLIVGTTLQVDTNVLYVDPTNNRVGINDNTPSVALDVTGSETLTGLLTGTTGYFHKIRAVDGNGLSLFEDGDSGIFIENGGQVGINDTTPSYQLDVNGIGRFTGALTVDDNTGNVKMKRFTVTVARASAGATVTSLGVLVDAGGENAGTSFILPDDCTQIDTFRVTARCGAATGVGDGMNLLITLYCANDNEQSYSTHVLSAVFNTVGTDYAADDVMYWEVPYASLSGAQSATGGDNVLCTLTYTGAAGDGDATNCDLYAVEIEYQ
jgi:hypothetical protein